MEVTMQWWDVADDLWFAARLRLAALGHLATPLSRGAMLLVAGLMLTIA